MALTRPRAFTLPEILVYCFLLLLGVGLVGALLTVANRVQVSTTSSYAVTSQVDSAIEWLRRDLQETALATIQIRSPGLGTRAHRDGPCISLISPRTPELSTRSSGTPGKLVISEYGVPRWTKHVFWGFMPNDGKEPRIGDLVRWEVPLSDSELATRLPSLATFPQGLRPPGSHRVFLHNLVQPGANFPDVPNFQSSVMGGLDVRFVQRANGTGPDVLTMLNPASNPDATSNTRLVRVELSTVDTLSGKSNYCALDFTVMPRY